MKRYWDARMLLSTLKQAAERLPKDIEALVRSDKVSDEHGSGASALATNRNAKPITSATSENTARIAIQVVLDRTHCERPQYRQITAAS